MNKVSLAAIEGAVFVLALDDVDYDYDPVIIYFSTIIIYKLNSIWNFRTITLSWINSVKECCTARAMIDGSTKLLLWLSVLMDG